MSTSIQDFYDAMIEGLGSVIEDIAKVQPVPDEEDTGDYAQFDGREFPPVDPDSIVVIRKPGQAPTLHFEMRDGRRIDLFMQVSPPWPS